MLVFPVFPYKKKATGSLEGVEITREAYIN